MTTHAPALLALGAGLRDASERRDISLRELARVLGIHPANLSTWELGTAGPNPATVARILGCLQAKGAEHKQLTALADHANRVDQTTSSLIDLLGAYQQLSSRIIEWAPFRVPDLLQASTGLLPVDATDRSGPCSYVFMVGEQALSAAGGEPRRTSISGSCHRRPRQPPSPPSSRAASPSLSRSSAQTLTIPDQARAS